MSKVTVIQPRKNSETNLPDSIRRAGHEVHVLAKPSGTDMKSLRDDSPDAIVIEIERQPSLARAVGIMLRQQKATREVPIIFVGGEKKAVDDLRHHLPDATYTTTGRIASTIKSALKRKIKNPIVPGTMDGYSGTPLPKKLGIKPGSTVILLNAPKDFEEKLGDGAADVTFLRRAGREGHRVMLFVTSQADLAKRLDAAEKAMAEGGGLWVAWPKKTSGVSSDLTENHIRELGLRSGLIDYKVCAIDAIWSGLCFARRKK